MRRAPLGRTFVSPLIDANRKRATVELSTVESIPLFASVPGAGAGMSRAWPTRSACPTARS